jgi:hypothetical protein
MEALALPAEQAEYLHRLGARGAEPVRQPGIEFRHLAGSHGDVVVGEDQPHAPGQHVQPLVALMSAGLRRAGRGRDDHLPRLDASRLPGERHDDPAVAPPGLEADPRVPDLWRADELIERQPVSLGDRQQEFQAGLPFAGFQPRQGAFGDARRGGHLRKRQATLRSRAPQPRAGLAQCVRDRR